jgi:hypothetical protein
VVTRIEPLVFVPRDGVRVVRRGFWHARIAVLLATGGCAATGVTMRSNHFQLDVPAEWQIVDPGGRDELATVVRAPAKDGSPAVEMRLYAWLVSEAPADAAGDVLRRLAAKNVLGLAAAHADDAEPCPDRAAQFFVFGKPTRALYLTNAAAQRLVVTAGESDGSLVAVVAAIGAGGSGCVDAAAMDAAVERLVASLGGGPDVWSPARPPTVVPSANPTLVPP